MGRRREAVPAEPDLDRVGGRALGVKELVLPAGTKISPFALMAVTLGSVLQGVDPTEIDSDGVWLRDGRESECCLISATSG